MACVATLFVTSSCTTDGDVLFYRQGTGELGWICPVLAESTGYVYLGFAYESEEPTHTGSSVMCWDRDGNEVWTFPISNTNQPCGGFTLNAAEDRLYFGTYEQPGHMYCVNALTGAVIWQSSTSLGWPSDTRRFGASPALSADETVLYCGSGGEVWDPPYDQRFYACNALTGQLLWMYEASHDDRQERPDLQALPDSETAGCGFWPDPAVGPDGTIYAGNFNGILYAFNHDGTIKWQYETYWYDEATGDRRPSSFSIWHEIWGAPALNHDASVVYIAGNDWFVHAIDTATGQMLWKYECCFNCEATTTTAEIYTNPAVGPDGTIYVHSEDNYSYAFNPDGTLKWRSDAIYQALAGTDELAVEDETGWELCFTGSFTLLADGTLIAGVDTARHYAALNSSNGSLKWITKLNVPWSPDDTVEIHTEPVVDPVTNRVYGGTGWLGGLVCIEEGSTLDYSAPWPRSQKDNRCSGSADWIKEK